MLAGLDRDRLEALRRQVEEDYRLDIAAIERIERRYLDASNIIHSNPIPSLPTHTVTSNFDSSPNVVQSSERRTEQRPTVFPTSSSAELQNDEVEVSPRSMMYGAIRR